MRCQCFMDAGVRRDSRCWPCGSLYAGSGGFRMLAVWPAPMAVAQIVTHLGFVVTAGGGLGGSLPWASGYICMYVHTCGSCYGCGVGGGGVPDVVCAGPGAAIYVQAWGVRCIHIRANHNCIGYICNVTLSLPW